MAKNISPALKNTLRAGNNGADTAEPHDKEGDCLRIKVYEVVVFPKDNIIATAEEEVSSSPEL